MKSIIVCIFAIVFIVSLASAHMCLISPPQRGAMNGINTINAQDCNWVAAPCGGIPAQSPYAAFIRGTNFTITWQKNQNHWYSNNPGTFNISWADATDPETFIPIYSFVDDNSPPLTLYTYELDVANEIPEDSKGGILSMAYYTPGIPVNFYQCADVVVL